MQVPIQTFFDILLIDSTFFIHHSGPLWRYLDIKKKDCMPNAKITLKKIAEKTSCVFCTEWLPVPSSGYFSYTTHLHNILLNEFTTNFTSSFQNAFKNKSFQSQWCRGLKIKLQLSVQIRVFSDIQIFGIPVRVVNNANNIKFT